MKLRDYQQQAVDATVAALDAKPAASVLGVAATGLGKTAIAGFIIRKRPARVLVIAHREELINQAADKIGHITGQMPDIEKAERRADLGMFRRTKAVVASIQTMTQPARRERFEWKDFSDIWIDEAHRSVAKSYRDLIDYVRSENPDIGLFGKTATPDRLDEEAMGQVYETVSYDYGVDFGIRNGWLVNIHQKSVTVDGLDYSDVRKTAGDLNAGDLSRIMAVESVLQQIAHATVELAGTRKTLIFAPPGFRGPEGEEQFRVSERLCEILNRHKSDSAQWISGITPRDERQQILADYRAGRFQFLVNVDVFTEGYDEPGIEVVVLARATMSRAKFSQMIGRGTRTLPGVVDGLDTAEQRLAAIAASAKPHLEVLDFEGNCGTHKLVSVADVLGGNYSEEAVELAEKKAKESSGKESVLALLDQAKAELEARRRAAIIGKTTIHTRVINPFDVLGIEPMRSRGWDNAKRPSEKMVSFAKSLGMDVSGMSFGKVRQLLDEAVRRRNTGKASFDQSRRLLEKGLDPTVNAATAARLLGDPSAERIARLQERYKAMVGGGA